MESIWYAYEGLMMELELCYVCWYIIKKIFPLLYLVSEDSGITYGENETSLYMLHKWSIGIMDKPKE